MATIRPFMAIRPAEAYAKDVAALPYDVMNSEEAREMVQGKPWSFLHVDKAEVDLPKDIDVYSPAVYLPSPLKYRSGVFFCLRLSQKQVFDLGDRGINEWVPAAEPGNPSFSSAELNSACGVNSVKNSPNFSFRSRCFL